MNTVNAKYALAFWIGLLLCAPVFYFILVSLLKYTFGLPFLFDTLAPSLERWGAKEPLGFNINALILFGPLTALLLNLTAVVHLQLHNRADRWHMEWFAEKRWSNWLVIMLNSLLLLTLFVYAIGENCNCFAYHIKTIEHENNLLQVFWPYLFTGMFHGCADCVPVYYFFNPYLWSYCT